jgi:BirA family biotin operon repressor/biotin-[acetyl-CoA-carboxylase] ligase
VPATDPIVIAEVEAALGKDAMRRIAVMEHFATIESTNRYLLAAGPPPPGRMRVALAEYQQAGRGRRGRSWNMPRGSGIALSVAWQFSAAPSSLTALSLATGSAVRRAIHDVTGIRIGLKWPNDLIVDGGKLGGILIELEPLAAGGCHAVAGIGINVNVAAADLVSLSDMPYGARALGAAAGNTAVDRSRLAAALIGRLLELFGDYAATGFAPYRGEWLAAHVLDGCEIELRSPVGIEHGRVSGIDDDGALLVADAAGSIRRVVSADVTVRVAS